jgi:hypothetical protein
MNILLKTIRTPIYDFDEPNDEHDLIEYQYEINLQKINKFTKCHDILKNMIKNYTKEYLEEILYEVDSYGCTVLHYACIYFMKRVALLIIENTTKESNLYILSNSGMTPLIICCKKGKGKMQCVFDKIIEKTHFEQNLYIGKNHSLSFCIHFKDTEKAKMILEKTHFEDNLYKLGICYTPLLLSFKMECFDIARLIIQKTQKAKSLFIPDANFHPNNRTNIFSYLQTNEPKYCTILWEINKKYQRINSITKMKMRHIEIFGKIPQEIREYIGSYLYFVTL